MQSEADVQTDILNYLVARDVLHYRNNTGSTKGGRMHYGKEGSQDVYIFDNNFIGCEVKNEEEYRYLIRNWVFLRDNTFKKEDRKRYTLHGQILWHDNIIKAGCKAFFCCSLEMFLDKYRRNNG